MFRARSVSTTDAPGITALLVSVTVPTTIAVVAVGVWPAAGAGIATSSPIATMSVPPGVRFVWSALVFIASPLSFRRVSLSTGNRWLQTTARHDLARLHHQEGPAHRGDVVERIARHG